MCCSAKEDLDLFRGYESTLDKKEKRARKCSNLIRSPCLLPQVFEAKKPIAVNPSSSSAEWSFSSGGSDPSMEFLVRWI